ncbi:DNA damage-regulated autophagy modulator protein 2-like isoform X2 [Ornithodoros turicata]|uniref:DNA damage-regulated autophagy modulator protein 2-like isoform X2 n=1 Tax=Ornithodoros turicata TaxID=34597 RepID=UPI003139FA3A
MTTKFISSTSTWKGCDNVCVAATLKRPRVILYLIIPPMVICITCSHFWAVMNRDVHYFLPYISDAGGDPPQSAVFGVGLIIASIGCMGLFCMRYIMVLDLNTEKRRSIAFLNYLVFLCGIAIFFGIVMVAVNPTGHLRRDGTWLQPIFVSHVTGASMSFFGGIGYLSGNSALTFLLLPKLNNVRIAYLRLGLTVIDIVACSITGVKFPKNMLTMKPHPHKPRTYPEGTLYSILGEWVMLITVLIYLYTMRDEMDRSTLVVGLNNTRYAIGDRSDAQLAADASRVPATDTA